MVSLPEPQEQPTPKLESLVRAICQKAITAKPKYAALTGQLDTLCG